MLAPAPFNFAGGSITLPILEQLYDAVDFGSGKYEPNIITTTVKGYGYLRSNFQTQQRFQNVSTAKGGFKGSKVQQRGDCEVPLCVPGSYLMNPAKWCCCRTAPGRGSSYNINGTNDQGSRPGCSPTPPMVSGIGLSLPGGLCSATRHLRRRECSGGAWARTAIWIENIRKPMVKYRTSKAKPFDGSLQEFIPSAGNTKLVGKVLLAENPGTDSYPDMLAVWI